MRKAGSLGNFGGLEIIESAVLPVDFYAISDWSRPQASATPEWHQVWIIDGRVLAHPTVIEKMKGLRP